jgi:hypothetical protein
MAGGARKLAGIPEMGISKLKRLTTKVTKEDKEAAVRDHPDQTSSIFCYFEQIYLI